NWIGPLMAVSGVVYLSRDVMWLHSSLGDHLNFFLLGLFLALIAHQLVVYPHGRVRSRLEGLLVGAAYSLAVVGYLCSLLSATANDIVNALGAALALAILGLIASRWRHAGPPGRRALGPRLLPSPWPSWASSATPGFRSGRS